MAGDGWSSLFASAFHQSRNAMLLVDGERRIVDANAAFVELVGHSRGTLVGRHLYRFVAGGPLVTPGEWRDALAQGRFTGTAPMLHADGSEVAVQRAAVTETATGRRLVLFVTLNTSRWGAHFRRAGDTQLPSGELSRREREVVRHISLGRTGPEIADELRIAHDTVRTHVRNAMTKTGARSRAHLVAKALGEMQLAEAPTPVAQGSVDTPR
jgi:PAS domain S-box-containing protein